MIYATFADYTDIYLGRVIPSEEVFNRLSLRASAEIDRLTFGRAARFRLRDSEGKLILACCAVCEKLYALEEAAASGAAGGVAEEQVGDHRVKFRTWSGVTAGARVEIAALLELYLLRTGSFGPQVKALQLLLNGFGCDCGDIDGIFGSKTQAAVKKWQKEKSLETDGIVGTRTWNSFFN